ncbi:MAG: antibiotic biosynthesis monooxygenase [Alphaproteobacteria bacterium]|nr:antibiotic biosynthesis monooxygenase [Alphaproteobacteria bacterium]
MFIAMNRFKVAPGAEADTHLRGVPGFVAFHLLRGPGRDDHVLYSSHAVWNSRGDFEAWREMDFRFSRA